MCRSGTVAGQRDFHNAECTEPAVVSLPIPRNHLKGSEILGLARREAVRATHRRVEHVQIDPSDPIKRHEVRFILPRRSLEVFCQGVARLAEPGPKPGSRRR